MTDDFCFDWIRPCNLVLEICKPICRPRDHELVTIGHSRILGAPHGETGSSSSFAAGIPLPVEVFLSTRSQIACCVQSAVHALSQ